MSYVKAGIVARVVTYYLGLGLGVRKAVARYLGEAPSRGLARPVSVSFTFATSVGYAIDPEVPFALRAGVIAVS